MSNLPYDGVPARAFVAPIAPENITSANLLDYFLFDKGHCFSDTAGTTPATIGGAVALVKAQQGRSETLTQATSGNRPTLAATVNDSSRLCLQGNAATLQYMNRSVSAVPRTLLLIYEINKIQPQATNNQPMFGMPYSAGIEKAYYPIRRVSGSIDQNQYFSSKADGTSTQAASSVVAGPMDSVIIRDDGLNEQMWREGLLIASLTGTGAERPTSGNGVVLARQNGASVDSWTSGRLIAFVTFDKWISDSEIAGLSAWAAQITKSPQQSRRWLGCYFQSNLTDENASATCPLLIQTDDLKSFEYRPSGLTALALNNPVRDPSLLDFGGNVWLMKTGGQFGSGSTGGFRALKINSDHATMTPDWSVTTLFSGATASSAVWAPEPVKNKDGSVWLDKNGLPAIVFTQSAAGSGSLQAYVVQPTDATLQNWNAPVALNGSWPTTFIDASCMFIDGTFYLLGAGQGTNASPIYLYSAADLYGKWTQVSASLLYNNTLGYEAPQMTWLGDHSYILHVDFQGLGYKWCQSDNGPAGPYGPLSSISCAFSPQHGNVIPMPKGW